MGPYVEGFQARLFASGYTPGTIRNMLKDAGGLGRWMDREDVEPRRLDPAAIETFVRDLKARGMRRVPGVRSFVPLLDYLRREGVLAESAAPSTPVEMLMADYQRWLVVDRGLADPTVVRYENLARRFLLERASEDGGEFVVKLTGAHVIAFLLRESTRVSVGAAKGRVAELRSLLKFLYLKGLTPLALATAVPPVAGWRDTGVPAGIAASAVQRLLDSCDRTSPVGVRDFAILMLVARLGLRSAEVARLELGDIDWRAGQIVVRGKGRREDRLPLPCDVGEALTGYLSTVRPSTPIRHVFLACKAPARGIRPDLVSDVTRRACDRVGLPRVGAHRLRHSLATEMLRRGAALVGEPSTASSRPGHDGDLCQGRSRHAAQGRPALAGSDTVSALSEAAEQYLRLRRSLGHDLADAHRLLPRFVGYLDDIEAPTVTIAAAMAWAQQPDVDPDSTVWPRRMTVARGFARHMASLDARTEVPPLGLIPLRQRWRPPFIYSRADISALMAQARSMRWRLPAVTHETLIGLLAATGMRVGEAIRLDRGDIDRANGVLMIRESKFGKSRHVPVLNCTITALERYAQLRDQLCPPPATASFFVSIRGTRMIYPVVQQIFRRLCDTAGVGADAASRPRIHDYADVRVMPMFPRMCCLAGVRAPKLSA
jgi:integrase